MSDKDQRDQSAAILVLPPPATDEVGNLLKDALIGRLKYEAAASPAGSPARELGRDPVNVANLQAMLRSSNDDNGGPLYNGDINGLADTDLTRAFKKFLHQNHFIREAEQDGVITATFKKGVQNWLKSEDPNYVPREGQIDDKATAESLGRVLGKHKNEYAGSVEPPSPALRGRQEEALRFFESKEGGGWSREQAAGIVANLTAESGLRTDAVGDSGNAMGIGQWHKPRQDAYAAFAKDNVNISGKTIDMASFRDQLAFVNHELTSANLEWRAGNELRQTRTAEAAGAAVSKFYERPLLKQQEANLRGKLAERIGAAANVEAHA